MKLECKELNKYDKVFCLMLKQFIPPTSLDWYFVYWFWTNWNTKLPITVFRIHNAKNLNKCLRYFASCFNNSTSSFASFHDLFVFLLFRLPYSSVFLFLFVFICVLHFHFLSLPLSLFLLHTFSYFLSYFCILILSGFDFFSFHCSTSLNP